MTNVIKSVLGFFGFESIKESPKKQGALTPEKELEEMLEEWPTQESIPVIIGQYRDVNGISVQLPKEWVGFALLFDQAELLSLEEIKEYINSYDEAFNNGGWQFENAVAEIRRRGEEVTTDQIRGAIERSPFLFYEGIEEDAQAKRHYHSEDFGGGNGVWPGTRYYVSWTGYGGDWERVEVAFAHHQPGGCL